MFGSKREKNSLQPIWECCLTHTFPTFWNALRSLLNFIGHCGKYNWIVSIICFCQRHVFYSLGCLPECIILDYASKKKWLLYKLQNVTISLWHWFKQSECKLAGVTRGDGNGIKWHSYLLFPYHGKVDGCCISMCPLKQYSAVTKLIKVWFSSSGD